MNSMFNGSGVALVTPMTKTGAIDFESFQALIQWHLEQNTDAIIIAGSTGEAATLNASEWSEMMSLAVAIVKKANKSIPIIAGTGTNSTAQTVINTERAQALGCDGALIVMPYYNRPTQEGLYLHCKTVAESVDLPIILYNVPYRTASDLSVETTVKLSEVSNIIGIKDATGELQRVPMYIKQAKPGFKLYAGNDESAMDFMGLGGHGVISVAANLVPKMMHTLCQAVFNKDKMQAESINLSLEKLYSYLGIESNPIPVKWALHAMGQIENKVRLPLTPLSVTHHAAFSNILQQLELIQSTTPGTQSEQSHCA